MSLLPHSLPLCALLCGAGVAFGSIGFYYYFPRKRKKAVEPAFPTIDDGEEEGQAEGKPEQLCESVVETGVNDGEVNCPQEDQTTQVPQDAAEASLDEMVESTVTSTIDYRHPPTVWIIGDGYIGCGEETARRCQGTNLGVNPKITWFGEVGLRWRELIPFFSKSLEERGQVPDILVIHCSGNDLAEMNNVQLVSEMKNRISIGFNQR